MEAHGLALRADTAGALSALRDAEKAFGAAKVSDTPAWLGYFDDAYLAAKFGRTFRDLGKPREAEQFARRSLEMSEDTSGDGCSTLRSSHPHLRTSGELTKRAQRAWPPLTWLSTFDPSEPVPTLRTLPDACRRSAR
jgi:hypothetical protein